MWGQFDFAFQAADGKIQGSDFTSEINEPALRRWGVTYDISDGSATNTSGLSCGCFCFPSKPNTGFHVFYQVDANEIIEARKSWGADTASVQGDWTYQAVPIKL